MAAARSATLSHLISTNEPPSLFEVAQLRRCVQTLVPRARLLWAEYKDLEERLQLCRIVLSPTRRLPAEILIEIFSWADKKTLLNISLVCRSWNASFNVVSSKSLSTTTMRFISEDGIPCHKILSWLAKPVTGTKTLNIEHEVSYREIRCKCFKPANPCPWAAPDFLNLLAKNPTPAQMVLRLKFSSPNCLSRLVGGAGNSLLWNSLETLHLQLTGNWSGRASIYRNALDGLPKTLRNLRLKINNPKDRRQPPPIEVPEAPFNTLKSLGIECSWDSPLILSILRLCVDLDVLIVDESIGRHTWTENAAQVTLPKVHTLRVKCLYLHESEKIFPLLHLPALASLTIDGGEVPFADRNWVLARALRPLGLLSPMPRICLRTLVVQSINGLDGDALWDIFSHLRFLRCLVLQRVPFEGAGFLESYRRRTEGGEHLLPALRMFELRDLDEKFDATSFLCFVKVHRHATTRRHEEGHERNQEDAPDGLRHISLRYGDCKESRKFEAVREELVCMVGALERDFGVVVQMTRG